MKTVSFPHRSHVRTFRFLDFDFYESTAFLRYGVDDAVTFEERIQFHDAPPPDAERMNVLTACLRRLHLAAGVSYYKAYIPPEIRVEGHALSRKEADFFNLFYRSGLGEFSFRNGVTPDISFPFDEDVLPDPSGMRLPHRIIVPVGGGKDSIVTLEMLKKAGRSPVPFSVGLPRPIRETIELSDLPSLRVTRTIAPGLMELNRRADEFGALNGHVPVTGIIAFILAAASVLYGFSDVAMSNERSANVGNTEKDGLMVNHQWSKSVEFERAFAGLMKDILPDFHYFSLLRPLSELSIARLFSETETYDRVFTSCNRAFRLDETKRLDRWCGECDKCRFVFLALAPFMGRDRLLSIFGRNPLNEAEQAEGFRRLLGLSSFKPFECVGEIEESVLAFSLLAARPEWRNDAVIRMLDGDVAAKYRARLTEYSDRIFALSDDHCIPKEYADVIELFKR